MTYFCTKVSLGVPAKKILVHITVYALSALQDHCFLPHAFFSTGTLEKNQALPLSDLLEPPKKEEA